MSNLDDFFKKRDKKKKTAKSKFPTLDTDELAKNLEASVTRGDEDFDTQENNYDRPNQVGSGDHQNDDEWKPFESDENKDLSGLRIQTLKLQDETQENLGATNENEKKTTCRWAAPSSAQKAEDFDQDDEDELPQKQAALSDSTNQKQPESTLPPAAERVAEKQAEPAITSSAPASSAYLPPSVRRQMQQQQQQQQQQSQPQPQSQNAENTSSTPASSSSEPAPAPKAYVPPALRNAGASSGSGSGGLVSSSSASSNPGASNRRPNKAQPNINDTLEFPTLDAAVTDPKSDKQFEETNKFDFPKKAARIETKSGKDTSIDLQNKFTALSSNN